MNVPLEPQLEDALARVHTALVEKRPNFLSHWRTHCVAALLREMEKQDSSQPPDTTKPKLQRSATFHTRKPSYDHKQDSRLFCQRCGLSFQDKSELSQHVIAVHERVLLPGSLISPVHQRCGICQAEMTEGMALHKKMHHPNACMSCRRDFDCKEDRARHNIDEHNHQYVCQFCLDTFRIEEGLRSHQEAKGHLIKCSYCDTRSRFKDTHAFEQHVLAKHAHDSPYMNDSPLERSTLVSVASSETMVSMDFPRKSNDKFDTGRGRGIW